MCRQEAMLNVALKLAQGSEHYSQCLGAVIARGHRIISVGWNKSKTHPKQLPYMKNGKNVSTRTVHAELDAIIGVPADLLFGATIYVARALRVRGFGLAKPCAACRKAIEAAGIRRMVYTTNSGYESEYV